MIHKSCGLHHHFSASKIRWGGKKPSTIDQTLSPFKVKGWLRETKPIVSKEFLEKPRH